MKKKMILKFWKFCNRASCLHNTLPQRTAASNTECTIIQSRNWITCNVWYYFELIKLNKNQLTPFSPPPTQNVYHKIRKTKYLISLAWIMKKDSTVCWFTLWTSLIFGGLFFSFLGGGRGVNVINDKLNFGHITTD